MTGKVLIGDIAYDPAETAQLKVFNNTDAWPGEPGLNLAVEIPTGQALTFGDANDVGLWFSAPGILNTNANFRIGDDLSVGDLITTGGNINASGDITSGATITGNILSIANNATVGTNITADSLNITSMTSTGQLSVATNADVAADLTVNGNIAGNGATIRGNTFSFFNGSQFTNLIAAGPDPMRIVSTDRLVAPSFAFSAYGILTTSGGNINSSAGFVAPNISTTGGASGTGTITANTMLATSYTYPSDERFKKDIETLENVSDKINSLNPVTYVLKWDEFPERSFDKKIKYGFIAQEIEKIFPDFVSEDEQGYKRVSYVSLVPVLVKGYQEQQYKIERLQIENKELNQRLEELEKKVAKILSN